MAVKPVLNQFNGGEISPWLEGRSDWDKYNYSAKLCRNFIPLIEGSLKRRGGSHFVYSPNAFIACKLVFKIISNTVPTLSVNDNPISLSQVEGKWVSDELVFNKNTEIQYSVSSSGYLTVYNNVVVSQDETIEVVMEEGEMVTLTIARFSDDVEVEVNGVKVGDTVEVPRSYLLNGVLQIKYFRVLIRYQNQVYDKLDYITGTAKLMIFSKNDVFYLHYMYGTSLQGTIVTLTGEENTLPSESNLYIFPEGIKLYYTLIGGGGGKIDLQEELYGGGGGAYVYGYFLPVKGEKYFVTCGKAGENEVYQTDGGESSIANITGDKFVKSYGGRNNWPTEQQGVGGGYDYSDNMGVREAHGGEGNGNPGKEPSAYSYPDYGWGAQKVTGDKTGNGMVSLKMRLE